MSVCMFLVCTVFAPIQYYLWIYAGSANANFYFAISLAFSTAQVNRDLGKSIINQTFNNFNVRCIYRCILSLLTSFKKVQLVKIP